MDEKAGKLTSTKKKEDVRPHDLIEIEEERSSSEGGRPAAEKGKMPSNRAGTNLEEICIGLQNGHFAGGMVHASGAVRKQSSTVKCKVLSTEKQGRRNWRSAGRSTILKLLNLKEEICTYLTH